MKFLYKIERKYGKYAIKNLMMYIIGLYIIGWFIQILNVNFYYDVLALDVAKVLHGEVWRLVTFIIMPPSDSSAIFMIFTLYLYYVLGTNLERVWGAFRFNLYFFMGILFHIIAAFLIFFIWGYSWPLTTYYLNMSLFFAFACVYPDMELLLFFIIPIKIKWLAVIDGIYFGAIIFFGFFFDAIFGGMPADIYYNVGMSLIKLGIYPIPQVAVAALVSLLNFVVFFLMTRNYNKISPKEIKRKKVYKNAVNKTRSNGLTHKCHICGRTSDEYPDLTFRYCSKCNGNYEYCNEHLFTHEHVK